MTLTFFLSHQNINSRFTIFSEKLKKIGDWFNTSKSSLNNRRAKYTLFHKKPSKDDLPLKIPALKIVDNKIKRSKFLGVMLDRKYLESSNKTSRSIAR